MDDDFDPYGVDNKLVTELAQLLNQVENGDVNKNISVRDDRLAAIYHTLDNNDELLQEIAWSINDDRDPKEVTRSELFKDLIRIGLEESAPQLVKAEKQARLKLIEKDY